MMDSRSDDGQQVCLFVTNSGPASVDGGGMIADGGEPLAPKSRWLLTPLR